MRHALGRFGEALVLACAAARKRVEPTARPRELALPAQPLEVGPSKAVRVEIARAKNSALLYEPKDLFAGRSGAHEVSVLQNVGNCQYMPTFRNTLSHAFFAPS